MMAPQFITIVLRGFSMFGRFMLLFVMAKHLPVEDIGTYGLFFAAVSLAIYLLGYDFYTFANREVIVSHTTEWSFVFKNQIIFYILLYSISLPFLILIFTEGYLGWELMIWFYTLLLTEHLGQEAYRLLVAVSRPFLANLVLFCRTGGWSLLATVGLFAIPDARSLNTIFSCWLLGSTLSILICYFVLPELHWRKLLKAKIDFRWILRGIKVSSVFLVGTFALRALFSLDRFLVDEWGGKEAVGVYTFYIGMASAMLAFLEAGVISHRYPRVVSAFSRGDIREYRREIRGMTIWTVSGTLVLFIGLWVGIGPLLQVLGKSQYYEHVSIFPLLLLAYALYAFSLCPHYSLYARRSDLLLTMSSIFSLGSAIILFNFFGSLGLLGVVLGLIGAFLTMFLCKSFFAIWAESKYHLNRPIPAEKVQKQFSTRNSVKSSKSTSRGLNDTSYQRKS